MHVYNHILTFTKLATYSASVVKSSFGNFGGINPFIPPWIRPCSYSVSEGFGSSHGKGDLPHCETLRTHNWRKDTCVRSTVMLKAYVRIKISALATPWSAISQQLSGCIMPFLTRFRLLIYCSVKIPGPARCPRSPMARPLGRHVQ